MSTPIIEFPSTAAEHKGAKGALLFLIIAVGYKLLNRSEADYDLWIHVKSGLDIIQHSTITYFDQYSFTAFGEPIINHEWLSQVILAAVHLLGGGVALSVWRWVMVLGCAALMWRLIRFNIFSFYLSLIPLTGFLVALSPGSSFRLHLFSYLGLLSIMLLCERGERYSRKNFLIFIPGLMLVWSNLHGAFPLGLLVLFGYSLDELGAKRLTGKQYRYLTALLIGTLVTVINPFGLKLWSYIFNELTNPLSSFFITEWQRFSFASRELPLLLFAVITGICLTLSSNKKRSSDYLFFLIGCVLGYSAVRHAPISFIFISIPLTRHFESAWGRSSLQQKLRLRSATALNFAAASFFLTALYFTWAAGAPKFSITIDMANEPLPVKLVALIKANKISGNLWVPLHWGGYVVFHLNPNIKVSIDPRWATVYPGSVMHDTITFSLSKKKERWKEILHRYGANMALVEREHPALQEMKSDNDWVFVAEDKAARLLVRKDFKLPSAFTRPEAASFYWP